MYERDIQQQEEGKGLNRGTPEHLAISDVSISMVTHYFDESFLRTEEDYVNRGTPKHFLISDVPISMERVTHYFDESFLRTEEDYVNTYSKSHLSDSIVSSTIFSEEFAMIYLIHA